jgi:dipeptidyl aminopeptidase/acylaminoacyl peptidase
MGAEQLHAVLAHLDLIRDVVAYLFDSTASHQRIKPLEKDLPMKSARIFAALVLLALCTSPLRSQDELGRRALDHADYDKWNSIGQQAISEDGKWIAFAVRPAEGAGTLTIREVASQKQYTILNGSGVRFNYDSRFAAYLIQPDPDLLKKLKEDKDRRGERPKPKLEIVDFINDRHVTLHDVRSFRFPEKAAGWIAYSPSKRDKKAARSSSKSKITESYAIESSSLRKVVPGAKAPSPSERSKKSKQKRGSKKGGSKENETDKENGDVLVLWNLESGIERRFPDVTSHRFSKYGALLAFASSGSDAEADGVFVLDLSTDKLTQVISGRGNYHSLAFSEDEKQLAFLSDRDDYGPVKPSLSLYLWTTGRKGAKKIVMETTDAIPEGWWLASTQPQFTEDGRRVLFETQPKPDDAGKSKDELDKEKKAADRDPKARLDIWHWKDTALQPQQILQANRERNRGYRALYDLKLKTVVQLATKEMPNVRVDVRGRGDVAIGTDSMKYAVSRSWESPPFSDSYLVDLNTGKATLILEKVRATASLSPGGLFITWWNPVQKHYYAKSISDQKTIVLSEDIPSSLANELHDTPSAPRSYGRAGWLDDDKALLLYDRFDIWQVDPTGKEPAKCLTAEQGRANRTRYRYLRLDNEQRSINLDEPLMLSAFNEESKASGYSKLNAATGQITSMLMLDERVDGLRKAKQGDTVLLTRQTFRRSPDLWATTIDFKQLSRISSVNPQQRDYLWGTSELVHYKTKDGQPLDGLLYKPDNFDPTKKYPMMVYFYERSSNNLHRYHRPSAGSSSINFSFYVSRGYVLFVPDIPYKTGYPGRSAANAVLPGIQTVVDLGFVDPDRIGVQGHSWGGYQIAYLVTMTNIFACAEAGAPVTNMTSAYGGIRWGTGLSRMFQYEKTQSRIGKSLWAARDLYLENSPVFFADKIETPLLMLHNDQDGAVPWYQGIELFVAMRRLEKPVWMLNYNGETHGLRKKENRVDFARRMQQFFDHHLQGAPATQWIAEGVPAVNKGKQFGFEPAQSEEQAETESANRDHP